jgi:putative molybdopterin biosynthesis protein
VVKREVYPKSTPLSEALAKWTEELTRHGVWQPLPGEVIPVDNALGRITAQAVTARLSSPSYHAAAMDGVAVRFVDTVGASETRPKRLRIGKEAVYVDTGDPLPDGMDAVIMIEEVDCCGQDEIEIIAPVTPYKHVRTMGEDLVATELILPENHEIRPVDLGAILAGGLTELQARRLPVVGVLPTGSELVQPGCTPKQGQIIEFNSRILCGLIHEWGGRAIRHDVVPDTLEAVRAGIQAALECADMVVVNAGSSAGREDFTIHAIRELGEVFVQGVSIKPGKPVILGVVDHKPVVGIPGYPVSAVLTLSLFVKPLLFACQGRPVPNPQTVPAVLSRQISSAVGQEEFVRVTVGVVGPRTVATPVSRGAGKLMSLVRAGGIVRIPALSEGIAAGEEVRVELFRSTSELAETVVCIGSHDNTLDILANVLKKRHPRLSFSSSHVGSMGGLLAIKRGEAHLAGTHLLDEESGEYNAPFLRRLLSDRPMVLVNLVYREQGLLVPRGNPKGVGGLQDLARDDLVFINRQKGSGTRLLTDGSLRKLGLLPEAIRGYEREEYTHMGVASAVAGGTADAGVGILAAARALSLDFIPVARERFDFAIPSDFLETEAIQRLLGILRDDPEFKEMILALGGYDVSEMGAVVYDTSLSG